MFSKEKQKFARNLETKNITFNEKFSNLGRKMNFYLTTSASTFSCFRSPGLVGRTLRQ